MKKLKLGVISILAVIILSLSCFIIAPENSTNFVKDIVKKVRELVPLDWLFGDERVEIVVSMYLAPNGDIDKNGEIDSGDFVRFEYVITNNNDQEYSWLNLETNINRKELNTISNFKGITGIDDDKGKLTIPNIRLYPKQTVKISFDARVSYTTKKDIDLYTEPKLKEKSGNILSEDSKKLIKAKKATKEKMDKVFGNKGEVEILSSE